jgi:hypothetical protein
MSAIGDTGKAQYSGCSLLKTGRAEVGPRGVCLQPAPGRPAATTSDGTGAGPTNSAVRRIASVATATILRLAGGRERNDASAAPCISRTDRADGNCSRPAGTSAVRRSMGSRQPGGCRPDHARDADLNCGGRAGTVTTMTFVTGATQASTASDADAGHRAHYPTTEALAAGSVAAVTFITGACRASTAVLLPGPLSPGGATLLAGLLI